jgi:hypothetical protein
VQANEIPQWIDCDYRQDDIRQSGLRKGSLQPQEGRGEKAHTAKNDTQTNKDLSAAKYSLA